MFVMVRYTLAADRKDENEALVRAVYEELARVAPAGLRYVTSRDAEGIRYVHFAEITTADGVSPLLAIDAFKRFTAAIADRCVEPPITLRLEAIGRYGI